MKGFVSIRFVLALCLMFTFTVEAQGRGKRKKTKHKQKNHLVSSIKDAKKRSDAEQERIQIRMDEEADMRIEGWKTDKGPPINLTHKGKGKSSIKRIDLGKPDYSVEEHGEETSGFNLRSDYEEESVDIDFDEELREVSSLTD